MGQWLRFKREYPGCLLFFRMGDFYELFDRDAVVVHEVLGLTLTERTKGMPMAGVPYHAVEHHLRRLIELGYRVAICDQLQDPKDAKGVMDRGVTRVLTPGTLVDEALLDERRANQLAAVAVDGERAAIALIELSTGAFSIIDARRASLADELARIAPSELLVPVPDRPGVEDSDAAALATTALPPGIALAERPSGSFRAAAAAETLRRHFGVASLEGFGLHTDEPATRAAGALLRYLLETQAGVRGADGGAGLAHLRPPRRIDAGGFLVIDATSLRSLEVERTLRSGSSEGTLLASVDRCRTSLGRRLLRTWLAFPLRDRVRIEVRQSRIAALVAEETFADALAEAIAPVQDVARIAGRIGTGRALPRDLVALARSLECAPEIARLFDGRDGFAEERTRLASLATTLTPLAEAIAARCVEHPPPHLREGGLFRDGIDSILDEARLLQRDANAWLARYQRELVESTGIGSLKVGFNKVFGFYIEITHANAERIPAFFSRKQTLKNAERYITPELKAFEEKVLTADARAIEREKELFAELCAQAAAAAEPLAAYAELVAELDVLCGLAEVARRERWCRPTLVDEPKLEIREGRHPVVESILRERFVPNDCELGGTLGTLALITGPNMAGKSTFIRQTALVVLLAHVGSFVPAATATVGLADRIFTRIGASDELHTGQSTFMVEMTETANILHHATERSVVILDEIGRGTSTLDGLSLAWAIAETLADRGCRTLFATHYHELTTLADRLPAVVNLHVAVREWEDRIVFLHRILPGRTDRSYGIHVAQLAGLPAATVARARELLDSLAVESAEAATKTRRGAAKPKREIEPMPLFAAAAEKPHPLVERLRAVELERLTPLQAFDLLRSLRDEAAG
jgi:DNA mismatch repair protein MutS